MTTMLAVLTACGNDNGANNANSQQPLLQQQGIVADSTLLVTDTLSVAARPALPDTTHEFTPSGIELSPEQRGALLQQTDTTWLAAHEQCRLVGIVPMGNDSTLMAFTLATAGGDDLCLVTYNATGEMCDKVVIADYNAHLQDEPHRLGGNRITTMTSQLVVNDPRHITVTRTMTNHAVMLKQHQLRPRWSVTWQQLFTVDADGHFSLTRQHEVSREGEPDQARLLQAMTRDMGFNANMNKIK